MSIVCWIRSPRQAGFSMIGILLVLVIIFLLAGYFFTGGEEKAGLGDYLESEKQAASAYQHSMGRAKSAARGENLRTLQATIDMWALSHPGERCTIEKLQADGRYTIPQAPAGYQFEIDENNKAVLAKAEQAPPFDVRGVPISPNPPQ